MAIGWLSVLQAVPWGQVIDNAPKIVNGAKKLWSSVATTPDSAQAQEPDTRVPQDQNEDAELLRQRLANLEQSTAELHQQMMTSTALIKELAEQNAQLIRHIEANRVRTFWLVGLGVVATVVAVFSLALVLAPSLF
jgi:hypothetical protein